MKFGINVRKTLEWSLHASVFMYFAFLSTFCISNQTLKITRISTLYQAKRANFDEAQFLKTYT